MKNNNLIITLAVLLAFVLGSCAGSSLSNIKTEKERLSQKVYSAEEYSKKCLSPSDYHSVGGYQFALESRVFRHKNCLGVDDMLMIMWADEPTDRNIAAATWLGHMYAENKGSEEENVSTVARLLGMDTLEHDRGAAYMLFFELIHTNIESE